MSGSDLTPGGILVRRIRFASHSVTSGRVCRTFKHPRPCLAVEDSVPLSDVPVKPAADELFIVFAPVTGAVAAEKFWGTVPDASDPDAPALDVKWRADRILWRPGLAVVYLGGPVRAVVQAALIEFAFYEGELRRLEAEMDAYETAAPDDVGRAYTIDRRDRPHWARFGATMAALARMRLELARLVPRLVEEADGPGPVPRRFASHLLYRVRAESRAGALDTRLEACEDLYEGANDRVADHNGWHRGHVLEVIIVALLLMEVVLLCMDLSLR